MTGRVRGRMLVLVVAVAMTVVASSAHPVDAVGSSLRWGWGISTKLSVSEYGGDRCTPSTKVWSQEMGKSGVTRLRAQFDLRGPYDPGYLPSWSKTTWGHSGEFPDDAVNYWNFWTLQPGVFTFGNGKRVAIWAKFIGERPSFWQRDEKIHARLGEVECQISINFGS